MRLIPTKQNKLISSSELNKSHYLGKWVEGNITLKDSDGKLSASAIHVDSIPGFSTNKIPPSVVSDLDIIINSEHKKYYNELWVEGTDGEQPENDQFYLDNYRQKYFIKISDIDGYTSTCLSADKKPKKIVFVINTSHAPVKANFTHFEFRVIADGKEVKDSGRTNTGYKRVICGLIRDKVQDIAIFNIP